MSALLLMMVASLGVDLLVGTIGHRPPLWFYLPYHFCLGAAISRGDLSVCWPLPTPRTSEGPDG